MEVTTPTAVAGERGFDLYAELGDPLTRIVLVDLGDPATSPGGLNQGLFSEAPGDDGQVVLPAEPSGLRPLPSAGEGPRDVWATFMTLGELAPGTEVLRLRSLESRALTLTDPLATASAGRTEGAWADDLFDGVDPEVETVGGMSSVWIGRFIISDAASSLGGVLTVTGESPAPDSAALVAWDLAGVVDQAVLLIPDAFEEAVVASCPCDVNTDDSVTVLDLLDFLAGWFPGDVSADFNGDGSTDVLDLLDFLGCWFPASSGTACP